MIHAAQAKLWTMVLLSVSLAFECRIERRKGFNLRLSENVGGRDLMFAVAFLGELNIDAGCFGGDGGQFDQSVGGAKLAVFQLQPLRFHHSEQLLDDPARLIPIGDLPRLRRIGDAVRGQ
jgi:hypothetical protein